MQWARSLDPGNFSFRSCAWAFMELGQTDRAMDFVHLDAGSEWAAWAAPYVYLTGRQRRAGERGGKKRRQGSVLPSRFDDRVYPDTAASRSGQDHEGSGIIGDDGAPIRKSGIHVGALMAYCGQKDAALRLLKSAVQQIIARTRRSWTIRY